MLERIYILLAIAALLATFLTVLTVDTRGFWSDIWLFTGPMGLLLALLLAAASINIETVSNGTTLQHSNEYLVVLWTGLGGFNVLYLVYGPIAKLREALNAGPSAQPFEVGQQTDPSAAGREARGRIMDSWRDDRAGTTTFSGRERRRRPRDRDDTDTR